MSQPCFDSEKIFVGRVSGAHNLKGEVYIHLFTERPAWLEDLEGKLWLSEGDDLKSYVYHRLRRHKKGVIVHFEGLEDRSQAESLKGKDVFIPKQFLQTESQSRFYLIEILNFKVRHEGELKDGEVVGFSDNSTQDLLQIKTPKGVYEVPLVEEFILNIDYQEKTINLKLPEGLVEWC